MQFIDLATQQKRIRNKIEANITAVLDHGKYITHKKQLMESLTEKRCTEILNNAQELQKWIVKKL